MKRRIALILVAALIIAPAGALEVGDEAPPFANPSLGGGYLFSRDLLGNAWIVIDFFATDCEPCKKELPLLEAIQEEYAELGLRTLVFATDPEGEPPVRTYFDSSPTPCTVVIDRYGVAAKRYEVETIPSLFLVSPDGTILVAHSGYSEEAIAEIRSILASELRGDQ